MTTPRTLSSLNWFFNRLLISPTENALEATQNLDFPTGTGFRSLAKARDGFSLSKYPTIS